MNSKAKEALTNSLIFLGKASLPEMGKLTKSCHNVLADLQKDKINPTDEYMEWAMDVSLNLALLAIGGVPILEEYGIAKEELLTLFHLFSIVALLEAWRLNGGKMAPLDNLSQSDMDWLSQITDKLKPM